MLREWESVENSNNSLGLWPLHLHAHEIHKQGKESKEATWVFPPLISLQKPMKTPEQVWETKDNLGTTKKENVISKTQTEKTYIFIMMKNFNVN